MVVLVGRGGLYEDNCGTWDYTPTQDLQDPTVRSRWFSDHTGRVLELLQDFAQVESVEVHARNSEEWEWKPDHAVDLLISQVSSDQVHAVVIWLTLNVHVGEQDLQLDAASFRLATYQEPSGCEVSLHLESNAYAGRRERLSMEAIQVNQKRLEAFLRRVEGSLDVEFNYCESQSFPNRIHRYGYA